MTEKKTTNQWPASRISPFPAPNESGRLCDQSGNCIPDQVGRILLNRSAAISARPACFSAISSSFCPSTRSAKSPLLICPSASSIVHRSRPSCSSFRMANPTGVAVATSSFSSFAANFVMPSWRVCSNLLKSIGISISLDAPYQRHPGPQWLRFDPAKKDAFSTVHPQPALHQNHFYLIVDSIII